MLVGAFIEGMQDAGSTPATSTNHKRGRGCLFAPPLASPGFIHSSITNRTIVDIKWRNTLPLAIRQDEGSFSQCPYRKKVLLPRYILTYENGDDGITVLNKEPVVVVHCNREDLKALGNIDESKRPGIYILMGGSRRYVGQASASVFARVNTHDKSKDFWNEIVFITREDGRIDKSQLDYMESKLISEFANLGYDLDNANNGNTSFIEAHQRHKSNSLISESEELLKIIGIDLKEKASRRSAKSVLAVSEETCISASVTPSLDELNLNPVVAKPKSVRIEDSAGNVVEDRHAKKAYASYFRLLISNPETREDIFRNLKWGFDTHTEEKFYKKIKSTIKIEEGVYLHVHLSFADIQKRVRRVAEYANIHDVTITRL